jgi:hypothetical protein
MELIFLEQNEKNVSEETENKTNSFNAEVQQLEEWLKQIEMFDINGGNDIIFWRSKYTDELKTIGIIPSKVPGASSLYGMPFNKHSTKDGFKFENITLKGFDPLQYPDGLRPHIHKVKNSDGSSAFLFENKKYTQEDLVKLFNPESVKNRDFFRYALQCLRVEEQTVYEPYIVEKDNHLYFPENTKDIYADPNNELQREIVKNLKIGKIDEDFVNEGRNLLKKYPKQAAIYLIVPAQLVVNVLGIEDFLYTLEIISERDTGKSFAVRMALHHFEGMTDVLGSNILNTSFRKDKILSGTNLSLYNEEAELSSKIKRSMKTPGITGRGKPDLTLELYKQFVSMILSANSYEVDDNQDEQKAIDKRFLQVFLNKQDVVPEEERTIGKRYLDKMKKQKGGLLFTDILKHHTIDELKEKYFDLDTKYHNRLELLLHYGEFLTGITYEDLTGIKHDSPIDFGEKEEDNWLLVFYHWVKGIYKTEWYKQRNIKNDLKVDYERKTISKPIKDEKGMDTKVEENFDIIKEITFSEELYQIFVSEHRNVPFDRLKDFRKKYIDFIKVDTFSINNQKARFTKIICDDKFNKSMGIDSESDKESREKSKGLFED